MKIEYKGFSITQTGATGKFVVSPDATAFNLDGYATLNNAKGAITKHLNKTAPVVEIEGSNLKARVMNGLKEKAIVKKVKAASSDDKDHATYTELSAAVKADADRTTALLRYYGLVDMTGTPRNRDYRSRNKREGGYVGKVSLKYIVEDGPSNTAMRIGHMRRGKRPLLQTLREVSRYNKSLDQGE
jgi:hypothetical protein